MSMTVVGVCGRSPNPITSAGHNLEDAGTCGLANVGDLIVSDATIGPLADNGGPNQTHALLPGSPAIDAGGNAGCPAADQRGAPRGDNDRSFVCDIGAYERQGPLATTPSPSPTPFGTTPSSTQPALAPAQLPGTGSGRLPPQAR